MDERILAKIDVERQKNNGEVIELRVRILDLEKNLESLKNEIQRRKGIETALNFMAEQIVSLRREAEIRIGTDNSR